MRQLRLRHKINLAVALSATALVVSSGSLAISMADWPNQSDDGKDYSGAAAEAGEAAAAAADYDPNRAAIDALRDEFLRLQGQVDAMRLQSERNARAANEANEAATEARDEAARAKAKALEPCIIHGIC